MALTATRTAGGRLAHALHRSGGICNMLRVGASFVRYQPGIIGGPRGAAVGTAPVTNHFVQPRAGLSTNAETGSAAALPEHVTVGRVWSEGTKRAVNALRSQNNYYATVVIKGRHFTVTQNDVVVMDRMNDVELGDVLDLSQVAELGSKDYTIKGQPFVDPAFFKIEATVIEHPVAQQVKIVKKRRHTGYQNTKIHQHRHTLLRISLLEVNRLE